MGKIAIFLLSCMAGVAIGVSTSIPGSHEARGSSVVASGGPALKLPELDLKQQLSLLKRSDTTWGESESILVDLKHALSRDPVSCLNELSDADVAGLVSIDEAVNAIIASQRGDVGAAITTARTINDGRLRKRIQLSLFRNLVAANPSDALDLLKIFPSDDAQAPARMVVNAMMATNPEDHIADILALKDFGNSSQYAFEIWGNRDPDGALRYICNSKDPTVVKLKSSMPLLGQLFNNSLKMNPRGALSAYASLPENLKGEETLSAAYRAAAFASPEVFAAEMRKSDKSFMALRAAIDTLAYAAVNTPAEADRIAALIPSERARAEGYRRAATNRMVTGNFKETASWTQEIKEPLARRATADAVATRWAGMAPAEAVSYAMTELTDPDDRSRFLDRIAQTWTNALSAGKVSPDEKFIWVDALSEAQKKALLGHLNVGPSSGPQLKLLRDRLAGK